MSITGGCYCGDLRYEFEGEPVGTAQCHCRECQYFTGGEANQLQMVPLDQFKYTNGAPETFARKDLDGAVTREFCRTCGTPMGTRAPHVPGIFILKAGTLDDPSRHQPGMAIYLCDKQPFHRIAEGLASFDKMPG